MNVNALGLPEMEGSQGGRSILWRVPWGRFPVFAGGTSAQLRGPGALPTQVPWTVGQSLPTLHSQGGLVCLQHLQHNQEDWPGLEGAADEGTPQLESGYGYGCLRRQQNPRSSQVLVILRTQSQNPATLQCPGVLERGPAQLGERHVG